MKISVEITRDENAEFFNVSVGDRVQVEFEEYVVGVVASEIGNSAIEACKAQAVAARSYAVNYGVLNGKTISDSSSRAQAYRAPRAISSSFANARRGTLETEGQLLFYNNKIITAGRTVSSKERWGNERPYLIAQDDPWDAAFGKPKSGHGVGMSQNGAKWAANNGIGYKEILNFYYPKTTLVYNYGKSTEEKLDKAMKLDTINEKAEHIIRNAQAMLGYPYVYGAIGELCTPVNRGRRARSDHPTIVSKCQVLNKTRDTCDGCKWKGARMFDCRGFTYYLLKQEGINISAVGATTQYDRSQDWDLRGEIKDMPNVVCCVFKKKGDKMEHTGMYIGDGQIIHASSGV